MINHLDNADTRSAVKTLQEDSVVSCGITMLQSTGHGDICVFCLQRPISPSTNYVDVLGILIMELKNDIDYQTKLFKDKNKNKDLSGV